LADASRRVNHVAETQQGRPLGRPLGWTAHAADDLEEIEDHIKKDPPETAVQ